MTTHADEVQTRINKLERIRALGVNPFAARFDITHPIGEILTKNPMKIEEGAVSPFRQVEELILNPKSEVALAGRIMLHRSFGKICFATINDGTGRIQVLFSRENCSINVDGTIVPELQEGEEHISAYKFIEKLVDLGDFIGVRGELFYTHKGELTLFVKEFTLLTKAIRPLPEKWHGIEDDEERFRKRYLDMVMNDDLRAMFYRKAHFWKVIREFLQKK